GGGAADGGAGGGVGGHRKRGEGARQGRVREARRAESAGGGGGGAPPAPPLSPVRPDPPADPPRGGMRTHPPIPYARGRCPEQGAPCQTESEHDDLMATSEHGTSSRQAITQSAGPPAAASGYPR